MAEKYAIDVKFYPLPEDIAPCFTALSCLTVTVPQGESVTDIAPPEWPTMRFVQTGSAALAGFAGKPSSPVPLFSGGGPTSAALSYTLVELRGWALGLQPLGWARYSDVPACQLADRLTDGMTEPAYRRFRDLARLIEKGSEDRDELAEEIKRYLCQLRAAAAPASPQISACHLALRNPDLACVEELAEATGVSRRTLERLTLRYFGYSPKLLLRRQRFLRSLASFMLAGHRHWSEAIDRHYCDQAHFVRDFHRFMGMTPSEYAEMPHPVLEQVVAQRMAEQGAFPQPNGAQVQPAALVRDI